MQALQSFWSEFNIPAYDENTVSDDAKLPYITYEASSDNFGNVLHQTASVWYKSKSWADVTAKVKEIEDYITRGGRTVNYDGGVMWIQMSTPWSQRLSEPNNDMIRRIVLSITVEFFD